MIHDEALQSIGVSMLQADLCRRLWSDQREQDAAAELENLVTALDGAVEALRHVLRDLRVAAGAADPRLKPGRPTAPPTQPHPARSPGPNGL